MLDITNTFENGLKIDINNDYGFVRFIIDPTAIAIRKYPIITHSVEQNGASNTTLWTNNIDMLPNTAFSCKLHEPYSISSIEFNAPEEGIITKVLVNTIISYSSYLSYELAAGSFIICKKNKFNQNGELNNQYVVLTQFDISSKGKQIEYIDYYTDEQMSEEIIYAIGYRQSAQDQWLIVAEQNVKLDFEDILLTGVDETDPNDERILTLRLRFNSSISSLKNIVQEEKIDTIGSKYPFFVRNGIIGYKEIPLSGLLTYHMDELGMFLKTVEGFNYSKYFPENLYRSQTKEQIKFENISPATDFYIERIFKTRVEQWLNNGKPKILRTAAEGNFIVRLMNISLSPMEQLGRKLHSFNATAYECADYKDLEQYFAQLANPINNYEAIEADEVIGINKVFDPLPISLFASGGQYILSETIKQMGLNILTFSFDDGAICLCNGVKINEPKSININPDKTLIFSSVQYPASATIAGERKLYYLPVEAGV